MKFKKITMYNLSESFQRYFICQIWLKNGKMVNKKLRKIRNWLGGVNFTSFVFFSAQKRGNIQFIGSPIKKSTDNPQILVKKIKNSNYKGS